MSAQGRTSRLVELDGGTACKDLDGREIAVTLPRSVIELESDFGAAGLCQASHGRAFWDVLANKTVRVLVRATLPRVVGSGEVKGRVGESLDLAITVKLGAVVDRDGLEQMPVGTDQVEDASVRSCD